MRIRFGFLLSIDRTSVTEKPEEKTFRKKQFPNIELQSSLQFSKKEKKKVKGENKEGCRGKLTGKQEDVHCCYIILFPLPLRQQPFPQTPLYPLNKRLLSQGAQKWEQVIRPPLVFIWNCQWGKSGYQLRTVFV